MNKTAIKNALFINGEKCKTKMELFAVFEKKFSFPDYFGNNWDAFEELISELDLTQDVLIINSEQLLEAAPDDKTIFLDIITNYNISNEFAFYQITKI